MRRRVTIVGLGPGNRDLRTLAAQRALDSASRIVLRTAVHPGIEDLVGDSRVATCDDLYESSARFEDIYEAIADRVLLLAQDGDLVYAVPGHPLFGERSVEIVARRLRGTDVQLEILGAVSAIDAVAGATGLDPFDAGVQLVDAMELEAAVARDPFGGGRLDLSPTRSLLVTQVYTTSVASSVKLALARLYAEDHEVSVVSAAGVPGSESITHCKLYEIDHVPIDHLTSLYVPAMESLNAYRSIFTLQRVTAKLRAPGGCPWDRKQSHASLRGAVIEEAYEVADAIDDGDLDHLAEELGDLLLQVALHSQIAEEEGSFSFEDVVEHLNRKLIRRHPHVFADAVADSPDEVIRTWDGVKAEERRQRGESPVDDRGPLDRLPRSMPILGRVSSLLKSGSIAAKNAANDDDVADQILALVEKLVAYGHDPESSIESAARRRYLAKTDIEELLPVAVAEKEIENA